MHYVRIRSEPQWVVIMERLAFHLVLRDPIASLGSGALVMAPPEGCKPACGVPEFDCVDAFSPVLAASAAESLPKHNSLGHLLAAGKWACS